MRTWFVAPVLIALFPTAQSRVPTAAVEPRNVDTRIVRDDDDELDPRDFVHAAKISLRAAIASALAKQPGRAVEAELEGERSDGKVDIFFEVMVVTTHGQLAEVRVDPASGKVIENQQDDEAAEEAEEVEEEEEAEEDDEDSEDDRDELPGFIAALRHSELDLAALVEHAEAFLKGTAISAKLEYEDGNPLCDIAFVNGRHVLEAELEARAGHLTEVELSAESLEHDEESDEESDEDDEHGGEDGDGDEMRGHEHGEHSIKR